MSNLCCTLVFEHKNVCFSRFKFHVVGQEVVKKICVTHLFLKNGIL
jgi:hypothetical protein